MKKLFTTLTALVFSALSAHASAYVVNTDGFVFGSSWDSPSHNVDTVLSNLEDSMGTGLTLNLVDQSVWSGFGATTVILEELAGYRHRTTFGWYNADSGAATQIFSGGDNKTTPAALIDFGGLSNVGFYIDPNGSEANRMYTQSALNSHGDTQVAVFEVAELANTYILGWEDLDLNGGTGGDRDYQDMIVRVQLVDVAEPGSIALLCLGLLGLVASRRMIK